MNPAILPFIAQHLNIPESELTPDRRLSDLTASSLDLIELLFAVEDKFGVELPSDINTKFETVGQLMEAMSCPTQ